MKSLRRSVNGRDNHNGPLPPISGPLSALPPISRPNDKTQPPKKVIRALESYRSKLPQELGFSKGDFFHVVQDSDESSPWYDAHNPMTGSRGLVPKRLFEEFNKANASSRASTYTTHTRNSASVSTMAPNTASSSSQAPTSPRLKTFFAVVIHDFQAERPDELDAKSGDNISVVAQSNREWFVAKPIGKLGRPGLIPVSFVELKDPATGRNFNEQDVAAIMERGDIPRVEEWKKAMVAYKAASIPLGVIDDSSIVAVPNSPFMPPPPQDSSPPQPSSGFPSSNPLQRNGQSAISSSQHYYGMDDDRVARNQSPEDVYEPLPFGILVTAEVVSFHFENVEYWFRVNAVWQPLDMRTFVPSGQALKLVLFRVYDDFYDFQIQLLDSFPIEAGRGKNVAEGGTSSRILPYMPGPVEQVDDIVTSLRQEELDQYLTQLCGLSQIGAHHVLRHDLVRQFCSCKPGDVVTILDEDDQSTTDLGSNTLEKFSELSLTSQSTRDSESSGYEEDPSRRQFNSVQPSAMERGRIPNVGDRSSPTLRNQPVNPKLQPAPLHIPPVTYAPAYQDSPTEETRGNTTSYYSQMSNPSTNANSTRLRSGSNANTPPISATNSQTAFIKIKIFDRTSDDLIAIRVSPRVSHRQLLEKVRERLGGEVSRLNYRNSLNTGFVPLVGDDDLRTWLDQTDKHVLYAE